MRTAPSSLRASAAPRRWFATVVLVAGMAAIPGAASALEQIQLSLGNLSGDGWQAQNVRLGWHLDGSAQVNVKRLTLPAPAGEIDDLTLRCRALTFGPEQVQCASGQLTADRSPFGGGPMPVSFRYGLQTKALSLRLQQAAFAGGRLNLELGLQHERWRLQLDGRDLDAAALARMLPAPTLPNGTQIAAKLDLTGTIEGSGSHVRQAHANIQSSGAGFANADGRNAAENLALQAQLSATPQGADWLVEGTLAAARGTLCIGSCWELPQQPVTLRYKTRWRDQDDVLEIMSFRYDDVGVFEASGSLVYAIEAEQPWRALDATLASADAGRLYGRYLQPLLIGTLLEDLTIEGSIAARIYKPAGGGVTVQSELKRVSFQDGKQRFGLSGLNANLAWSEGGPAEQSNLDWQSGHLYQIPIGATRLRFETETNALRLLGSASMPVFDGSLEVAQFSLEQPGSAETRWNLDAVLTPISMQDFSRAMGWPEMAGQLSGVIPDLHYAKRRLSLDGVLLIRAFDGNVTIRDLRVDNLLGVVPSLNADIRLRDIDLQQLTGTFSFGRIEGRLDGSMTGLVLQNWRPVAFDASFATPEGDESRHRISQRAVDNLTSLGGGVGGALSRSFLRVFDDFSYDRLGLSCRLHDGVCEMGGIAPAPNGYYIVKGGGLPRIDVIGYQRRVDWPLLVKRLEAVTGGGGPVIR